MSQEQVLSMIVIVFGGAALIFILSSLWALRVLRKKTESEKRLREECESNHKFRGLAHQG